MSVPLRPVARFFSLLALIVWLGGLSFIAIGAPAMFKVARAQNLPLMGPQMVGAALGNFTPVTYVCAVLALVGWFIDRAARPKTGQRLWQVQGVCLAAMLAVAFYAGRAIMPEMQQLQAGAVAATTANVTNDTTVRFKALHGRYRSATSTVVLLGLVSLGCFALRSARESDSDGDA